MGKVAKEKTRVYAEYKIRNRSLRSSSVAYSSNCLFPIFLFRASATGALCPPRRAPSFTQKFPSSAFSPLSAGTGGTGVVILRNGVGGCTMPWRPAHISYVIGWLGTVAESPGSLGDYATHLAHRTTLRWWMVLLLPTLLCRDCSTDPPDRCQCFKPAEGCSLIPNEPAVTG